MKAETDKIISDLLKSGDFKDREDVIDQAIEMFADLRRISRKKLAQFEKALDEGAYDIATGRVHTMKDDETFLDLIARV